MALMQEDAVRDKARGILGLGQDDKVAVSNVGQITTFNSFADSHGFHEFRGVADKPDGWYLPMNSNGVALVLETKREQGLLGPAAVKELVKNIEILQRRYAKVVGILYNGDEVRVFLGQHDERPGQTALHPKEHYLRLFDQAPIDKNRIYELTSKINNLLHFQFGIKNLNHRMIFTACALVAKRFGAKFYQGMDYDGFKGLVVSEMRKGFADDGITFTHDGTAVVNGAVANPNNKLGLLLVIFDEIKMSLELNPTDLREQAKVKALLWEFASWVSEISEAVNSDMWRGEDVMGIFFNEFNRYKKKSEAGQVFTPEHITDFMYQVLDVNKNDRVLDAAAGSGGFLVKAMANMITEAGGVNTVKASQIKAEQLFGVEFDREIYALACANMLIHKDGKTNLVHADARSVSTGDWIAEQGITKVLMNPPYENKYGCMKIVENVLDNVEVGTICGFILPDKKLEKTPAATMKRILSHHRLTKVVKLPEDLFFGVGVTTSVFVFEAGRPQDDQEFFACWMDSDGLVTVKNKGRHDVHGRWPSIEAEWVQIVKRQSGHGSIQWHKPVVGSLLSWQEPVAEFSLTHEDLMKTAMDYLAYKQGIDLDELRSNAVARAFYGADEEGLA